MSEIGALSVRIGAETSGLQRGLSQAQGRMQGFQRSIMPTIKAMAAVGAAATGAAAAIFAFGRAGMDAIDEQAKLARSLDGTIGGLRGLELAAADAGIAKGTLTSAVQRLSGRLGEAERGTGRAADAMETLGLRARDLNSMDVDQRMAAIADRIHEMGLSAAQTAALLRDMGIRQTEMVLLMRQGGDAIRDARQEVEDYGLAIDAVDAGMIEAANDAFSRLGFVVESVRSAVAVELAPIVLVLADRFNMAAREAGGFGNVVREMAESSARAIAYLADKWHEVRLGIKEVDVAIAGLELGFANFSQGAWDAVSPFFDRMVGGINMILRGFSSIPGVSDLGQVEDFSSSAFMGRIAEQADIARGRFNLLQMELNELSNQPMPSKYVDGAFDDIERRRQELADQVKEDGGFIPGLFDGEDGALGGGGAGAGSTADVERMRENLASRLESLRESLMNEKELEIEHHQQRMEELEDIRQQELIDQDEFQRLKEETELQHLERLRNMEQRAADQRAQIEKRHSDVVIGMRNNVVQQSAALLDMFAGKSKAAALASIALNKGLAIAQTIMNTQVAQMRAMAELGPIAGPPVAAKIGAMGAASVGLIAAQGLAQAAGALSGSGSNASSGVGGGSAAGGTAGAAQGSGTGATAPVGGTLTVEGITASSLFSGDAVRELAEELISYQQRGGRIVIA